MKIIFVLILLLLANLNLADDKGFVRYKIQSGDRLYIIYQRLGLNPINDYLRQTLELNNMSNINVLTPGQWIVLPFKELPPSSDYTINEKVLSFQGVKKIAPKINFQNKETPFKKLSFNEPVLIYKLKKKDDLTKKLETLGLDPTSNDGVFIDGAYLFMPVKALEEIEIERTPKALSFHLLTGLSQIRSSDLSGIEADIKSKVHYGLASSFQLVNAEKWDVFISSNAEILSYSIPVSSGLNNENKERFSFGIRSGYKFNNTKFSLGGFWKQLHILEGTSSILNLDSVNTIGVNAQVKKSWIINPKSNLESTISYKHSISTTGNNLNIDSLQSFSLDLKFLRMTNPHLGHSIMIKSEYVKIDTIATDQTDLKLWLGLGFEWR